MTKEYDTITAHHYAAYRPELHYDILKRGIKQNNALGLDFGCGTGQSAVALAHFCQKVIGLDSGKEMLANAIQHSAVEYQYHNSEELPYDDNVFDTVTFAGSLNYVKSQTLLDQVIRCTKTEGVVMVYDFEVHLDDILSLLEVDSVPNPNFNYNHRENFSGLDQTAIHSNQESEEKKSFKIKLSDLTHLLLSSKENYTKLVKRYGDESPYHSVLRQLQAKSTLGYATLQATTYFTLYTCIK